MSYLHRRWKSLLLLGIVWCVLTTVLFSIFLKHHYVKEGSSLLGTYSSLKQAEQVQPQLSTQTPVSLPSSSSSPKKNESLYPQMPAHTPVSLPSPNPALKKNESLHPQMPAHTPVSLPSPSPALKKNESLYPRMPAKSTSSVQPPITSAESRHAVINEYCRNHPDVRNQQINYAHMFYNDHHKIIYCYVPKAGCTNIKLLMGRLNHAFGVNETVSHDRVHDEKPANKFTLSSLQPVERAKRLTSYFKFVIMREPVSRMLSAYIDKLSLPLQEAKQNKATIKHELVSLLSLKFLRRLHPQNATRMKPVPVIKGVFPKPFEPFFYKNKTRYYVPFEVYLRDYLRDINLRVVNEHFAPVYSLCSPCKINYNHIGNIQTLDEDMNTVMNLTGIPSNMYDGASKQEHSSFSVDSLLDLFFAEMTDLERVNLKRQLTEQSGAIFPGAPETSISRDLLKAVFTHYKAEFDLYHSLFPQDTRRELMYV